MTVRVVTDSSADLDRAVADEHAVAVVPLKVRFDEEEFTDGVDLSPEEFWKRLRATNVLPHTTSPSPGDFEQAFSQLDAEGASGIVCVTLSSKVSATHQSARLAAERFAVRDSDLGRLMVAVVGTRIANRDELVLLVADHRGQERNGHLWAEEVVDPGCLASEDSSTAK